MDDLTDMNVRYEAAAEAIRTADALLIGAGAGMGVDSGLPDFRGPEGFWNLTTGNLVPNGIPSSIPVTTVGSVVFKEVKSLPSNWGQVWRFPRSGGSAKFEVNSTSESIRARQSFENREFHCPSVH
jgi:hypothetical protein